ncbi:Ubiquitin carboxyl-terminal hydrolase 8 [Frankliniella fusca]|uniref:ubiquitinyl hydrolase 1 n=1 Tax=Frankliniella fusca TaxID=407009 RepID=A0AAE1HB09_9NEOP|nr:Ubiquitin carboxyl-terminal hydrolase 8 [Frankliniella fusca]
MGDFVFSQNVGPRGLINIGQYTCYINSTIQCLLGCNELKTFLSSKNYLKFVNPQSPFKGEIAHATAELFQQLQCHESGEPYYGFNFLEVIEKHWPQFAPDRQMDAPEFMQFLLGALHEDLLVQHSSAKNTPKNGEPAVDAVEEWNMQGKSIVSHLFYSQIASFTMCPSCTYSSAVYPVSDILALPVPTNQGTTIEDCLATFFAEENPPDVKCSMCSASSVRLRQVCGRLAPYLIVHLKRFHQHYDGSLQKNTKQITFTTSLDLAPYVISGVQSSTKYHLVGSINHIGKKLHNGHYTAMSKRGNRWYCFNDSKVAGTTARHLCTDAGYLLLFEMDFQTNGILPFDSLFLVPISSPNAGLTHSKPTDSHNGDKNLREDEALRKPVLLITESSKSEENRLSFSSNTVLLDENMNVMEHTKDYHYSLELSGGLAGDMTTSKAEGDTEFHISQKLSEIQISPRRHSTSANEEEPQCDHPDFDLDLLDPILTEDDIPGAKLDIDNLNKCKKPQLKLWLSTRGLLQKGSKEELIQRIINHKARAHKIDPGFDNGSVYEAKRKKVLAEAFNARKQFPMMPTGAVWKPFPSAHIPNGYSSHKAREFLEAIPEVRFSYEEGVVLAEAKEKDSDEEDLFDFSQPTQQDRKRLFVDGTLKRANCFIDSGRVLSILDCQRDTHYFVKAQVQASMATQFYTVQIMIAKASGKICFTECKCKARALSRCCHIMSVLLLIGRHVLKRGHEAVTCTGRRCYWLAPGTSLERRPGVVRNKDEYYQKIQFHRQGHFDPRPSCLQNLEDRTKVENFKQAVFKMPQKILWWYQFQVATETEQQQDQQGEENEEYPDVLATEQIAEKCSHMLWKLNQIRHYSTHEPLHFPNTQEQNRSEQWFKDRSMRATASVAKDMLGLESARSTMSGKINFFRKHVWGLSRFRNKDMEYGRDSEDEARRAYSEAIRLRDPELDVIQTGMWVNPMYPMLSCSPDGIVVDTNGFVKLLEIKCPAVLIGMDPSDFEKLPQSQLRAFCLRKCKTSGKILLKENHKYFYQVQMSMDILNLDKCDFVVYSKVNNKSCILTIEVTYDESFWNEKRQRLIRLHRELLVPEHFLENAKCNRPIRQLVYTPFHEEYEDNFFWQGRDPEYTLHIENENEVLINAQD